MSELNREQIIKALECCHTDSEISCNDCPYMSKITDIYGGCVVALVSDALSLIKELTCENESLEDEKEHLEKVVDGKLKRTSALEKSVLVLTEDNLILATELTRAQEENERLRAKGEWIENNPEDALYRYTCTLCGKTRLGIKTPYCANCGGIMKGE